MSSASNTRWYVLLGFAPIAFLIHVSAPDRHTAVFVASVLAILPLAAFMGQATETLADHLGGGIGGLLNATFGNAAELIIGIFALHAGLIDLVKASITGSIIGNVLLVFGAAALAGGLKHNVQKFNKTAAGLGSTMLLLSTIGLVVPAVFHYVSRNTPNAPNLTLDTEIAFVLLATYVVSLIFTLRTHRRLYGPPADKAGSHTRPGDVKRAVIVLLGATVGIAFVSELLVGSVSATAQDLGLSELFIGVVVVALVGNAAEHYSAITAALDDEMTLALEISIGSSAQIALMVAPVLILISYAFGPPMSLVFNAFEITAIGLSVLAVAFVAMDGESNWLEGFQLLGVYLVLALAFYLIPE